MSNTTNGNLTTGKWELVTTATTGSIANVGLFDIQICESDITPSDALRGTTIQPKKGKGFSLTAGQSIYAKGDFSTVYALTLE